MWQTLLIRMAVAVTVTAVAVPVAAELAARDDAPLDRPTVTDDARPEQPQVEPTTGSGHARVGLGDDGFELHLEGRDDAGASGSAGISMTDDGFRLQMDSDSAEGRGSAGVSMTDDGMRLWFDVDDDR